LIFWSPRHVLKGRSRAAPLRDARPGPSGSKGAEPLLKSILSVFTGRANHRVAFDPPSPDAPFYVIGDIHGCLGPLTELIARIDRESPEARLVFVGDYIDRGEESRGVIDHLRSLDRVRAVRPVFLAGNHEVMCLQFLDAPYDIGKRWLRFGGLQTLASYGVGLPTGTQGASMTDVRHALADAMGADTIAWIRSLPRMWRSGNVVVVHAAADPEMPIEAQTEDALIWGHPKFGATPRRDGLWVAHGHTIVDRPVAEAGKIAVDTGAYATGHLTAARVSAEGVSFLTT